MTGRRNFSELRARMAPESRVRAETKAHTMAELLSRFDPEKHRHTLKLDVEPVGTETR